MTSLPLILTLKLDKRAQAYFDELRQKYFPPERNYLNAHLTLFHQLPDDAETLVTIANATIPSFEMEVTGLRFLGAGVAYNVDSYALKALQKQLSKAFQNHLIPQDKQPFQPHITVQNKVTPEAAKQLHHKLTTSFQPFKIQATGFDLWRYLGGPWQHIQHVPFS